MQLTIELTPSANRVRLVEREALFAGDVYDPVVLAFPRDVEVPEASAVTLALEAPGMSSAMPAASSFVAVPGHPRLLRSSWSLSTRGMQELWERMAESDAGDGEEPLASYGAQGLRLTVAAAGATYADAAVPVYLRRLDAYAADSSFTSADRARLDAAERKLAGIEAGAERNVIVAVKYGSAVLAVDDDRTVTVPVPDLSSAISQFDADARYVAKEAGKGLSANDFTSAFRAKLESVESDADANVIETVKVNGVALTVEDRAVDIPVPRKTQPDWEEDQSDADSFIRNRPRGNLRTSEDTRIDSASDGDAGWVSLRIGDRTVGVRTVSASEAAERRLSGRIDALELGMSDADAAPRLSSLEASVLGIAGRLDSLGGGLSDADAQIAALGRDMSDADARMAALETAASGAGARIGALETAASGAGARIGALETAASDADARIGALGSEVEALRGRVDLLDDSDSWAENLIQDVVDLKVESARHLDAVDAIRGWTPWVLSSSDVDVSLYGIEAAAVGEAAGWRLYRLDVPAVTVAAVADPDGTESQIVFENGIRVTASRSFVKVRKTSEIVNDSGFAYACDVPRLAGEAGYATGVQYGNGAVHRAQANGVIVVPAAEISDAAVLRTGDLMTGALGVSGAALGGSDSDAELYHMADGFRAVSGGVARDYALPAHAGTLALTADVSYGLRDAGAVAVSGSPGSSVSIALVLSGGASATVTGELVGIDPLRICENVQQYDPVMDENVPTSIPWTDQHAGMTVASLLSALAGGDGGFWEVADDAGVPVWDSNGGGIGYASGEPTLGLVYADSDSDEEDDLLSLLGSSFRMWFVLLPSGAFADGVGMLYVGAAASARDLSAIGREMAEGSDLGPAMSTTGGVTRSLAREAGSGTLAVTSLRVAPDGLPYSGPVSASAEPFTFSSVSAPGASSVSVALLSGADGGAGYGSLSEDSDGTLVREGSGRVLREAYVRVDGDPGASVSWSCADAAFAVDPGAGALPASGSLLARVAELPSSGEVRFRVSVADQPPAALVGGKVPEAQLPSYVDDVVEFSDSDGFSGPEPGKLYISRATGKVYRWSGSMYVAISSVSGLSFRTVDVVSSAQAADVTLADGESVLVNVTATSGTPTVNVTFSDPGASFDAWIRFVQSGPYAVSRMVINWPSDGSGADPSILWGCESPQISLAADFSNNTLSGGGTFHFTRVSPGRYVVERPDRTGLLLTSWKEVKGTVGSGFNTGHQVLGEPGSGAIAIGLGSYATHAGALAQGRRCAANAIYSTALGYQTTCMDGGVSHRYSFVWRGCNPSSPPAGYYKAHADGSFNISPVGGLEGFYVGESKMSDLLARTVRYAMASADVSGAAFSVPASFFPIVIKYDSDQYTFDDFRSLDPPPVALSDYYVLHCYSNDLGDLFLEFNPSDGTFHDVNGRPFPDSLEFGGTDYSNARLVRTASVTLSDRTVTSVAPGAGVTLDVSVAAGTQGYARDCVLVVDCTELSDGDEPTVTWGAHYHPRTDTETDFAIVEAGKRAVFFVSEYASGEFVVGGWTETTGGNA